MKVCRNVPILLFCTSKCFTLPFCFTLRINKRYEAKIPITAQNYEVGGFLLCQKFSLFYFVKSVLLFTEVAAMVLFIVNSVSYFEMGAKGVHL